MKREPSFEDAKLIVKRLVDNGYKAYLAGGCVRDMVMNRKPDDYDIATSAKPENIKKLFKRVIPVGEAFGVMLVVIKGVPYEVATFRRDVSYKDFRHPERVEFSDEVEDARRRDFTINGLFMEPFSKKIIDYVGGLKDIENQIVRAIGDPDERFREDALRMLRAIRFSSKLEFSIDEETYKAILRNRELLRYVSAERIFDELNKIFLSKNPHIAFLLLYKTGIMDIILPEVSRLKGVTQPEKFHPEGDVFNHVYLMLKNMDFEKAGISDDFHKKALVWAVLLHDAGKYTTWSYDGDRIKFYGHDKESERIAREVLKRLKAPNKLIDLVAELVREHMKFMHIQKMRKSKLVRFLRKDSFPLHLELHRLDCIGSHKKLDNYYFCKRKLEELKEEELKPPKLINGYDLIALGFSPSPIFSKILQDIEDLQIEGKIKTKEEALKYIRENYTNEIQGRNRV